MRKDIYEEDGWVVEPVNPHNSAYRYCQRCRKEKPVEDFTRLVSGRQALYTARREGIATDTEGMFVRAAILSRTTNFVHKMCNICAAQRRKARTETATEYELRLRLSRRYELLTPNPDYVDDIATPNIPKDVPVRELMVRKYKQQLYAQRFVRKSERAKSSDIKKYSALLLQVRTEIARSREALKLKWVQESSDDVADMIRAYIEHLDSLRENVRRDRYAHDMPPPKDSPFKYTNLKDPRTIKALNSLWPLTIEQIERFGHKFLGTAEIVYEKYDRGY